MFLWKVNLYGIQWHEGIPEDYGDDYDPSELPENLEVSNIRAEDKREAIELALAEATDEFCFLIEGTEQINAEITAEVID